MQTWVEQAVVFGRVTWQELLTGQLSGLQAQGEARKRLREAVEVERLRAGADATVEWLVKPHTGAQVDTSVWAFATVQYRKADGTLHLIEAHEPRYADDD